MRLREFYENRELMFDDQRTTTAGDSEICQVNERKEAVREHRTTDRNRVEKELIAIDCLDCIGLNTGKLDELRKLGEAYGESL